MSFTYTPGSARNIDKIRLLIGDTDGDTYIFEDSELNMALSLVDSDLNQAAAVCCRSIATSRAKQAIAVKIMGDISIDKTKIPGFFMELADKFEKRTQSEPVVFTDSFLVDIDNLGIDRSERKDDDELW